MPNPETQESTEEALRRLRADVAAFRSGTVRDILFADEPPQAKERSMESLEAQLISMRTSLSSSTSKIAYLEKELESASQSASRDRDEAESLKLRLSAQANRLIAERQAQEKRATELEKQHIDAVTTAAENAALLRLATGGVTSETADQSAQLAATRAALAAAEPALARARADLAAARTEADLDRSVAAETTNALRSQLHSLESEANELRHARDIAASNAAAESTSAARAAHESTQEIAELRAENATRAEEALRLRSEAASRMTELRDLRAELRRQAAAAADVPRLQARLEKLADAERNAQNDRTVIDALREQRDALTRLIGALAPSGVPSDGLAVLRIAASRRAEGKPAIADEGSRPSAAETEPVVSREEVAGLAERLSAHAAREADAKREANEAVVARDEALADARRNKRLRKILEKERNYLRDALQDAENELSQHPAERPKDAAAAVRRATAAENVADQYRQVADELGNTLREKEAQLAKAASATGVAAAAEANAGDVHRDLCVLLRAQLRDANGDKERAQQERRDAQRERDETRRAMEYAQRALANAGGGAEKEVDYDERVAKAVTRQWNPLAAAAAEDAEVRMAVDSLGALKKRMRGDGDDAAMADVGGAVDGAEVRQLVRRLEEVEEVNRELERKSKVGLRTGELAKKKIDEMRSVLWNLFGWELKTKGAFYTLASIYAEREDEVLEFAITEKKMFNLRPGVYTDRLAEEIELYLTRQNSIPSLMAAITLDNFGKTTVAQGDGGMK